MSDSHPSLAELLHFYFGGGAPSDADPLVAHLVPDCPACAEAASSLWSDGGQQWQDRDVDFRGEDSLPPEAWVVGSEESGPEAESESQATGLMEIMDRVFSDVSRVEREVNAERADAQRCLPRLLRQPVERQLMLVRNSRRFQTWAFCEALVDACFERRHDDPRAAEQLARAAVAAASQLDAQRYGPALVRDLQGRCWTSLANSRRMLGEFRAATHALAVARSLLLQGTGSPIDEAWANDVEASLHAGRGAYERAFTSVGRSIRIYYRLNERHLLGRALIQKGMYCGHSGQMGCEIVLARSGLGLIDAERDPRVGLAGWHNLCRALQATGYDRQALEVLTRARPLYLRLGDRSSLLNFQWLEGSIAASLGREEQAEGCLREAREGFAQLGTAFDAAFVSLELCELMVRQGRNAEVCGLAAEMIAVFEAHETRQEALAALILLRQAAERERVTEALLKRVGSSLRGVQNS